MAVCDVGDAAEVGDVVLRVADALQVDAARVLVHQLVDLLWVVGIEEADLDAELGERLGEERPGTAVEARRGDEVLAGVADREDRRGDRRLARGEGEGGCAAVDRREALLEHVAGRVHEARVDVAEFLQREEVRRVLGAVELVGSGRVDRDRARVRRGIGDLSRVQRERSESGLSFIRHG